MKKEQKFNHCLSKLSAQLLHVQGVYILGMRCFRSAVLNWETRFPRMSVNKYPGGAGPYVLYNM